MVDLDRGAKDNALDGRYLGAAPADVIPRAQAFLRGLHTGGAGRLPQALPGARAAAGEDTHFKMSVVYLPAEELRPDLEPFEALGAPGRGGDGGPRRLSRLRLRDAAGDALAGDHRRPPARPARLRRPRLQRRHGDEGARRVGRPRPSAASSPSRPAATCSSSATPWRRCRRSSPAWSTPSLEERLAAGQPPPRGLPPAAAHPAHGPATTSPSCGRAAGGSGWTRCARPWSSSR